MRFQWPPRRISALIALAIAWAAFWIAVGWKEVSPLVHATAIESVKVESEIKYGKAKNAGSAGGLISKWLADELVPITLPVATADYDAVLLSKARAMFPSLADSSDPELIEQLRKLAANEARRLERARLDAANAALVQTAKVAVSLPTLIFIVAWSKKVMSRRHWPEALTVGQRRAIAISVIWVMAVVGWAIIENEGDLSYVLDGQYVLAASVPLLVFLSGAALWRWAERSPRQ